MMQLAGWILIAAGTGFFLAGTLALIRFPDIFTRLHALTKADNLGLGLLSAGLALHSGSIAVAMKLLLIWLLILLASASVSHLITRTARKLAED